MLFIFIALWIIAGVLIITDPKNRSTRWGGAIAFFSGFGGLGIFLREYAVTLTDNSIKGVIYSVTSLMFTLSHQVAPYTVLIYSLIYSGVINKYKLILKYCPYIFFIPVAIMYLIIPSMPDYRPSYLILSVWVVPYIFVANILLIYSYIIERNERVKQQRLLTCILVTSTTVFAVIVNYILRALGIEKMWKYNTITITIAFIIFLYAGLRYGVMGVKVRFEKYRLDSTIKAITSGTSIMNHTIKNEVIKIGMCANIIKSTLKNQSLDISGVNENISFILDSTDFLTNMVRNIQDHGQDIILNEEINNIREVFHNSLNMVAPFIKNKDIGVENNFKQDIFFKCDSIYIQEVFHNILINAIESMNNEGKLKIDTLLSKKTITIAITDTGSGISKENLPYVLNPFFSTKRTSDNFGLGLSYCVNIMNKHGGKLDIISEKNVGTTILIVFRKNKVTSLVNKLIKRSLINE
ncbi:MAG: sensor histidine kinase [Ruminiclostridium sp.]